MSFVKLTLAGLIIAGAAGLSYATSVEDRIKPVGETCMAGDECAKTVAAPAAAQAAAAGRSAEEIYKKCTVCHATGAAGAPKFGDKAAWGPRIAKGKETLYAHAISGFNSMPAKGLCFDCSDEEIKATVDYMVDNAK